jgi:nickel-type superoxide dismutase maturation protease
MPRAIAALAAVVVAGWGFVRYRPSRVAIEGASMAPTLVPGDWTLVVSPDRYRRGEVVVVEHPGKPGYEMVKRIVGTPGDRIGDRVLADDEYWVEGDYAKASTDSRQFGPITDEGLKAKVLLIYWPVERRRVVH